MHMKTWKLLGFELFAIALCATSCNKPDKQKGGSSKLALTINDGKTSIAADGRDAATFTVIMTREDGSTMDVTFDAAFTANDTPFEGNKFTTKTAGEYTIVATYEGMTSNAVRVTASSLSLSVDLESIAANGQGTATFTVTYQDKDVTADASITNLSTGEYYAKGANTFTSPNYTGEFQFSAQYNNLTSNTVTVNVVAAEAPALRLIPSAGRVSAGSQVTFTVENAGEDVTDAAMIKMVDGDYIKGATYTMASEGTVSFVAEFKGATSPAVSISTKDFMKNVLIFKFTNVNCSFCPELAKAIEIASETQPIVEVAIHSSVMGSDPMIKDEALFSDFGRYFGNQLPWAFLDMFEAQIPGAVSSDRVIDYVKPLALRSAYAGIAASAKANGSQITATVNVTASSSSRDLYVAAMLLENGIRYSQKGSDLGSNYVHNHTFRALATPTVYGDQLGTLANNEQVTKTYTFDASQYDVNNCHVVCYVLYKDGDAYIATNAIDVPVNSWVDYEFVK